MIPAGINFPDFLYLIPITNDKSPEATVNKGEECHDDSEGMLQPVGLLEWTEPYLHNEILMSLGSFETFSAPYADSPPNTRPAISDMTLPVKSHEHVQNYSANHHVRSVTHAKYMGHLAPREPLPFLLYPINPPKAIAAA